MVQMAKDCGDYVIATASGEGIALVKSLGADQVVDYKSQDVTVSVRDVDWWRIALAASLKINSLRY